MYLELGARGLAAHLVSRPPVIRLSGSNFGVFFVQGVLDYGFYGKSED